VSASRFDRDILDFSKIESGMLTWTTKKQCRALIEGVVELLGTRAHAKGIELIAFVAPGVPEAIRTDGMRLRQVLTNLVGNAVKFTEKGGVRIDATMTMGPERSFLRFEVRDTGVGVPAEKRREIFDEFVQADSSHAANSKAPDWGWRSAGVWWNPWWGNRG